MLKLIKRVRAKARLKRRVEYSGRISNFRNQKYL